MYSENNMRIRCNGCSRVGLTYLICSVAEPAKLLHNEMWRLNGNPATFQIQNKSLIGKEKQQLHLLPHVLGLCRKCRRLQRAIWSVPSNSISCFRSSGPADICNRSTIGVESRETTPQGSASHTLLTKFYGSGRGTASCNSYAPCGEAQCNHVTRRGVSHKHIAGKLVLLGMLRHVRLVENSRNPRKFINARTLLNSE
jgi:ribosomal protein S27E